MELVTGDKRITFHGRKSLTWAKMGKPEGCMIWFIRNLVLLTKRVRGFLFKKGMC
jgi:hypothetical protein